MEPGTHRRQLSATRDSLGPCDDSCNDLKEHEGSGSMAVAPSHDTTATRRLLPSNVGDAETLIRQMFCGSTLPARAVQTAARSLLAQGAMTGVLVDALAPGRNGRTHVVGIGAAVFVTDERRPFPPFPEHAAHRRRKATPSRLIGRGGGRSDERPFTSSARPAPATRRPAHVPTYPRPRSPIATPAFPLPTDRRSTARRRCRRRA